MPDSSISVLIPRYVACNIDHDLLQTILFQAYVNFQISLLPLEVGELMYLSTIWHIKLFYGG